MFTPNIFLWLFSAFLVLFGPMEIQARGEIWNGAISLESDSLICCSDSTLIVGNIGETGEVTITDRSDHRYPSKFLQRTLSLSLEGFR